MGKLLNQFMNYFSNVTEEQLKLDWEELKEFNQFGPLMMLTIEDVEYRFSINNNEINYCIDNNQYIDIDNPYYLAA